MRVSKQGGKKKGEQMKRCQEKKPGAQNTAITIRKIKKADIFNKLYFPFPEKLYIVVMCVFNLTLHTSTTATALCHHQQNQMPYFPI